MSSPSRTLAPTATMIAAVKLAWRPTMPEPMSSARPASSSCRVWRMTSRVLMKAAPSSNASNPWAATVAPKLVPDTRPLVMSETGLLADEIASFMRDSSVG